jgi:adenylosuccinate lyase
MRAVWSEEAKLARWLEVELAATDAWAELGVVPAEDAAELRARAVAPTPARVAEIEARTQHDVAAFVDAVAEQAGPAARWLHYGLTSSDVLDTALALQIGQAGTLILAGVDRALGAVLRRAEEHRDTAMAGRTHGVHAEPITFGVKLAGWAFELARAREGLGRALAGMRVGKLSGTVGVYGGGDPEVERLVCERLDLDREPAATQVVPRDRHAALLAALALTASSIERFATEIRHLARTELREVMEPFGREQKGSSAMPHKRNPVVAERLCGLARVVRAAAAVGLENVALWHERDISHSSAERVVLPDAFLALDYMLDRFAWLVDGRVVDGDRMRRNLDASYGLVFSPRVLTALIESGLARDEAYRLVQAHALRAWEEELDFRALLEQDPAIAARLGPERIERAFDLEDVLRHVDVVFGRLTALQATLGSDQRETGPGDRTAESTASSAPRTHEQEEVHA